MHPVAQYEAVPVDQATMVRWRRSTLWARLKPGQCYRFTFQDPAPAAAVKQSAYSWSRAYADGAERLHCSQTILADNRVELVVMCGRPGSPQPPPLEDAGATPNPAPNDIQPGMIDLNRETMRGPTPRGRHSKYDWADLDFGPAGVLIPFETAGSGPRNAQVQRIKLAGYAWARRQWQRLRFVVEPDGVRVWNVTHAYD